MSQDMIRYDVLVQEALRGVVKKVLGEVLKTGLPGQHHFYISFDTRHPGVRLSGRMRQRYPEEMTIVLQHQFWDLAVNDNGFEVGLSFGGIPERLLIPYLAVKGFFDPSVQFGLQFEVARDGVPEADAGSDAARPEAARPESARPGPVAVPTEIKVPETKPAPVKPVAAAEPAPERPKPKALEAKQDPAPPASPEPKQDASGATVVSLDTFRKKT